ncbi:MAG TPA: Lrp/AsnC family transcriptional regulator [Rhodothermales bacterium]|nr:Lrp/AsnC family transcriptional regulator [Rhodothermales bacterium]
MERIDSIDAKILTLLQANGRMKRNAIAEEVGLSVPSVSERMRKLTERGVLVGYHAVVDAKRLHYDITAFIRVMVDGSNRYETMVEEARDLDEVLEIHSVTGQGSHILKVRTRNTTTLERLLSKIQSWPGVTGTTTSIVLSTYKETRQVAVEPTELFAYETRENGS